MRIPYSKIYRAFPELDQFSDGQCEVYVARTRARRSGSRDVMILGAGAAGVGMAIAMAVVTGVVIVPLAGALGVRVRREYELPMEMAVVGVHVVAACIAAMLVRDAWLRRAIRACIDAARCPKCDYSLLGLPVRAGEVKCPECGAGCDLVAMGLGAEDLLSPEAEVPSTG
jgi:hypothetical protein